MPIGWLATLTHAERRYAVGVRRVARNPTLGVQSVHTHRVDGPLELVRRAPGSCAIQLRFFKYLYRKTRAGVAHVVRS